MQITLNSSNLLTDVEALWKSSPELAENLMKCLEVVHQEQFPILSIGDRVMSRYGEATIVRIEKTHEEGDKYGYEVDEVSWLDNFIVDLSNGHWSYKENITLIND